MFKGDLVPMEELTYDFRKSIFSGQEDSSALSFEVLKKVFEKPNEDRDNDLFTHLREVLIVGRVLGVIPVSGVFKHSHTNLSFRWKSLGAVVAIGITAVLTFNVVLAAIQWVREPKRNALEIARSVHRTAQYFWGWIIYVTFLFSARKFVNLFKRWAKISSYIFYSTEDKHLRRDSILICGIILLSCILENAVLHLEYFKEFDSFNGGATKYANITGNHSTLETYYRRANRHWSKFIGYNGFLTVLAFIQHKWMLYTWNYLDILIAVFARALYFKFKTLYLLASEHLTNVNSDTTALITKSTKVINKASWAQIVTDHKLLYDLLQEIQGFFSHLVFGSYAVNIYYICIQLLIGLSPDISVNSLVQMIYGQWSFIHMAIRIYIVSICAARINVYAHEIRKVLDNCPIELYVGEIARIDKRVTAGPQIGLSGLGCFVVTKPFILSIVSVIFTFEIVLLQGVASNTSPSPDNCCCPPTK